MTTRRLSVDVPRSAQGVRSCKPCGGTGQQLFMNSWFTTDGLRKERCSICGGTGQSDWRNSDHSWVKKQALWRSTFPRHPDAPQPSSED